MKGFDIEKLFIKLNITRSMGVGNHFPVHIWRLLSLHKGILYFYMKLCVTVMKAACMYNLDCTSLYRSKIKKSFG